MTDETATEFDDEDIDLSALPDDELVEQMHDDLYDGLKEEIVEATDILLSRGWAPDKVQKCYIRPGRGKPIHADRG